MQRIYLQLLIVTSSLFNAQMAINSSNPHPSAILDLSSSPKAGGLLLPRVALQSTTDTSTIPTPAEGLMIFNTANAGTGANTVTAGSIYKYNGTIWKKLSSKDETLNGNIPKVIVFGRKTSTQSCNQVAVNANTLYYFALEQISNPSLLSNTGAFTAPQTGYYSFSVYSKLNMPQNANQILSQAPYLTADGLGSFTYKFRGSGFIDQGAATSGIVYLTQGQTTAGWQWNIGTNNCPNTGDDLTTGAIKEQSVIWEFVGNSL